MSWPVSVILLASGPDPVIDRALKSLARQTLANLDLVVVHDRTEDAAARRRIWFRPGSSETTFVRAPCLGPGAARNVGVRASRGSSFAIVDGSEDLDPLYLESAWKALENTPPASFAAPLLGNWPAAVQDAVGSSRAVDMPQLLASPWSVAKATLVRRTAFDCAGGFDESLPDLVEWDLLLTLAENEDGGVTLASPLVARFSPGDVPLSQSLRAERHLPSVRRIFQKHHSVFERHMAGVLTDRDRIAKTLWQRERALVARRDQMRAELAAAMEDLGCLRAQLRQHGRDATEWADLRRTSPVSRNWGLDRGRPIDRYYIEQFLADHAADVRGSVLEVQDSELTMAHGAGRVHRCDVLDIDPDNVRATVLADLRAADGIPSATYDCFILTQTLHLIDDLAAAVAHAHRILKPGGVLLVTLPVVSMVTPDGAPGRDCWRVTEAAARWLFETLFPRSALQIQSRGNLLAVTAFLCGLSCEDLETHELETDDPAYPLLVTVRAVKRPAPKVRSAVTPRAGAGILLYRRIASPAHDHHRLAISPEVFRSQLEQLLRRWHPIPLSELAEAAVRGEAPERAIALTFDGGYTDNLTAAVPILAEFGVPATFFLTAERPEERLGFWWDGLEAILLDLHDLPPRIDLRIHGVQRPFWTRNSTERRTCHDELYPIIRASPPAVRDDLLRQLSEASGIRLAVTDDQRRMAADDVRRLAGSSGVEIGAHGLHHLSLTALPPDQLHREVFECRSELERIIGRRVLLFAYPYGDLSPDVIDTVRAADFRFAVSRDARPLRPCEQALQLPRIEAPRREGKALDAWLERTLASCSEHPPS